MCSPPWSWKVRNVLATSLLLSICMSYYPVIDSFAFKTAPAWTFITRYSLFSRISFVGPGNFQRCVLCCACERNRFFNVTQTKYWKHKVLSSWQKNCQVLCHAWRFAPWFEIIIFIIFIPFAICWTKNYLLFGVNDSGCQIDLQSSPRMFKKRGPCALNTMCCLFWR